MFAFAGLATADLLVAIETVVVAVVAMTGIAAAAAAALATIADFEVTYGSGGGVGGCCAGGCGGGDDDVLVADGANYYNQLPLLLPSTAQSLHHPTIACSAAASLTFRLLTLDAHYFGATDFDHFDLGVAQSSAYT